MQEGRFVFAQPMRHWPLHASRCAAARFPGGEAPTADTTGLTDCQLLAGHQDSTGATALYPLTVPTGVKNLGLRTLGGAGDGSSAAVQVGVAG